MIVDKSKIYTIDRGKSGYYISYTGDEADHSRRFGYKNVLCK
jgi:hypothetical protein